MFPIVILNMRHHFRKNMQNRLYPIFTGSNLDKNEFPFQRGCGAMLNSKYSRIDDPELYSAILKLAINHTEHI